MNEDSKQKLSRPLDPSPRGSNRPAEKGNLPPSPRHPALFSTSQAGRLVPAGKRGC